MVLEMEPTLRICAPNVKNLGARAQSSVVYHKIGFVLDGFAHLKANVSVLSTFNVG